MLVNYIQYILSVVHKYVLRTVTESYLQYYKATYIKTKITKIRQHGKRVAAVACMAQT